MEENILGKSYQSILGGIFPAYQPHEIVFDITK